MASRSVKGKRKTQNPAGQKRQVQSIAVNSVASYLDELTKLDFARKKLWFRGVGNSAYSLSPSLFRHPTHTTKAALAKLEGDLNETFRMRSFPYTDASRWQDDIWDQLFFMQHYRVPTRLLDWSASPLVALHFAITSVDFGKNGLPSTDVAVWVLNPEAWNRAVYDGTQFAGGVLSPRDTWLKRYSPDEVYESPTNIPPVAIRGSHNSARIVAQQGFFTIFGSERRPLDDFYCKHVGENGALAFPSDCLAKIQIPKASVVDIKKEMFALGVAESAIYPDLEGLAFELKRSFEF